MKKKLYKVTADYRPNNPNKPSYYVWAENDKDAKKRFSNTVTWLDVYGVSEEPNWREVVANREKYSVFGTPPDDLPKIERATRKRYIPQKKPNWVLGDIFGKSQAYNSKSLGRNGG